MAEPLAPALRQQRLPGLLAGAADPHIDWLDLLWGPRFDRAAALDLARHHPGLDTARLLQAGERFDALGRATQQRLRRLILRHRLHRMAHAPHPAD